VIGTEQAPVPPLVRLILSDRKIHN
jgi:hypothetical protein